jgi:hypothetical protein
VFLWLARVSVKRFMKISRETFPTFLIGNLHESPEELHSQDSKKHRRLPSLTYSCLTGETEESQVIQLFIMPNGGSPDSERMWRFNCWIRHMYEFDKFGTSVNFDQNSDSCTQL